MPKGKENKMKSVASTPEERKRVLEFWIQYIRPGKFPDLVVDGDLGYKNGVKIASYIESVYGGDWTPDRLMAAVSSIKNELWGLGIATPEQAKTREQKAKEAAEKQRVEQIAEHNQAVLVSWLRDECPLGLIVRGDLYPSTQEKVIAYIQRNHASTDIVLTPAMLSSAVTTLSNTLDWFSSKPEDRVLRNQPVPKTREQIQQEKLSDRAKREAGLLPPERQVPSHANDGKVNSLKDLVEFGAKEELRRRGVTSSPIMAEADRIVVQNRTGKIDAAKTAEVRKIMIYTNGKLDEVATLKARNMAADAF
jgi:hypothetical protein